MSKEQSVTEMLLDLERRVAFHRKQEGIHAEKETLHREERAKHAAALAQASEQLEALKKAAAAAAATLREASPLPEPPVPPAAVPRLMSQRVAAVVRDWPADGPFRAAAICEEVNRRYAGAVRKPASVPTVRKYLLRLSRRGVICAVREGMPYAESLFQKI